MAIGWRSTWLSLSALLSVNLGEQPAGLLSGGHLALVITVFTMGKSELCFKTTLDILMVNFSKINAILRLIETAPGLQAPRYQRKVILITICLRLL
mgnify:CR=1 FL=1